MLAGTVLNRITATVAVLALGCAGAASSRPVDRPSIKPTTTTKWRHNEPPYKQYTTTTGPAYEPFSPEWLAQLDVPSDRYWDKVAVCETKGNWKDRGNFAGGLGIAYTTWLGFGGEEFGDYQWEATRKEQITVANRIAIRGYMNGRGQFTEPVGFNGWGCIRNNNYLKPPVGSPWQQAKEQA